MAVLLFYSSYAFDTLARRKMIVNYDSRLLAREKSTNLVYDALYFIKNKGMVFFYRGFFI